MSPARIRSPQRIRHGLSAIGEQSSFHYREGRASIRPCCPMTCRCCISAPQPQAGNRHSSCVDGAHSEESGRARQGGGSTGTYDFHLEYKPNLAAGMTTERAPLEADIGLPDLICPTPFRHSLDQSWCEESTARSAASQLLLKSAHRELTLTQIRPWLGG